MKRVSEAQSRDVMGDIMKDLDDAEELEEVGQNIEDDQPVAFNREELLRNKFGQMLVEGGGEAGYKKYSKPQPNVNLHSDSKKRNLADL